MGLICFASQTVKHFLDVRKKKLGFGVGFKNPSQVWAISSKRMNSYYVTDKQWEVCRSERIDLYKPLYMWQSFSTLKFTQLNSEQNYFIVLELWVMHVLMKKCA